MTVPSYIYFGLAWAIREHDAIIAKSGGLLGTPKQDQLDGLLEFITDDSYYPSYEDKLTHLIYSIIKNHYFADGNKRASIVLGAYFMVVNGYGGVVTRFIPDMEYVVLCVADDIISKSQLHGIVTDFIGRGEMGESNKLLVINGAMEYRRRDEQRQ